MILCGDRLVALMESGELVLGQVSPEGWREISRAQVVGSNARNQPGTWPTDACTFVIKNQLVCLEMPKPFSQSIGQIFPLLLSFVEVLPPRLRRKSAVSSVSRLAA